MEDKLEVTFEDLHKDWCGIHFDEPCYCEVREAKAAIQSLINSAVREAVIDELEKLSIRCLSAQDRNACIESMMNRLAELRESSNVE